MSVDNLNENEKFPWENLFVPIGKKSNPQTNSVFIFGIKSESYILDIIDVIQIGFQYNPLSSISYGGFGNNFEGNRVHAVVNAYDKTDFNINDSKTLAKILIDTELKNLSTVSNFNIMMEKALVDVFEIFLKMHNNLSKTILKNFSVKLVKWTEDIFFEKYGILDLHDKNPKLIYLGDIKEHEILFLYLLYNIGFDIIYQNFNAQDENKKLKEIFTKGVFVNYNQTCDKVKIIQDIKLGISRSSNPRSTTDALQFKGSFTTTNDTPHNTNSNTTCNNNNNNNNNTTVSNSSNTPNNTAVNNSSNTSNNTTVSNSSNTQNSTAVSNSSNTSNNTTVSNSSNTPNNTAVNNSSNTSNNTTVSNSSNTQNSTAVNNESNLATSFFNRIISRSGPKNSSKVNLPKPDLNKELILFSKRIKGSSSQALSVEDLCKNCSATVLIEVKNSMGSILGHGSGVVINSEGLIITNYHVVHDGFTFVVKFENKEEYITNTILSIDYIKDIALLKIDAKTDSWLFISSEEKVIRGQKVLAFGSPLGLMNTVSEGIVSGFREVPDEGFSFIQTTAPISPGSSGGALIDTYGELIGVIFASFSMGQNLNMAVPAKYIIALCMDKITKFNYYLSTTFSKFKMGEEWFEFSYYYQYDNNSRYRGFIHAKNSCSQKLYDSYSDDNFRLIVEDLIKVRVAKIFLDFYMEDFDFGIISLGSGYGVSFDKKVLVKEIWEGV